MINSNESRLDKDDSGRLCDLLVDYIHMLDMQGLKAPEAALAYAEYFERHHETGRADFDGLTHNIYSLI